MCKVDLQIKSNLPDSKYVIYRKNIPLVSALELAYGLDCFKIGSYEFIFNDDWFSSLSSDFIDVLYDQFYLSFISLILTRSERDRLIKKLRGKLI